MSSEDSDIEIKSALTKKQNNKTPSSPTEDLLQENSSENELTTPTEEATKENEIKNVPNSPSEELSKKKKGKSMKKTFSKGSTKKETAQKEDIKKLTTKTMVNQALKDLKSRKGVSLYAIKKYLKENYEVNTEKINYVIKNAIKKSVEDGTIVQTKGTGASGSFKLAPGNSEKPSKPKKPKIDKEDKDKPKKNMKSEKTKKKIKENLEKPKKPKPKSKGIEVEDKQVIKKKVVKEKKLIGEELGEGEKMGKEKKSKVKNAKQILTTAEKRAAMMKRKSIGTIIKPPKMKPKAKG